MESGNRNGASQALVALVAAALVAASCTQASVPEVHPTASITPTAAVIASATASATPTPEVTATPDISQFKVCTPEQFQKCPIRPESLFDGSYFAFLNTLSKPFDPTKIKDVPLVWGNVYWDSPTIFYSFGKSENPPNWWLNGPNFPDRESEPFRRGVTAAYTEVTDTSGKLHVYTVLPVEYYDRNHPDKNQWVITVLDNSWPPYSTDYVINSQMRFWKNNMKVTPLITDDKQRWLPGAPVSPLIERTFTINRDMDQRFARFVQGDISALSEPGMVLLTFANQQFDHTFE